ncbi:MAG: methylated-DNA--[protein]-cysteine S-methyltransferase [Oscillospiraceae bacterium]
MMKSTIKMNTPIGDLWLSADGDFLIAISTVYPNLPILESEILICAKAQLNEYFNGQRKIFNLATKADACPFTKSVWQALCEIPYGKTATYSEIASKIGKPNAARAVGRANHVNPLMIIVPCHRVIGKNGSLTGYAGGIDIKQALINIEAKNMNTL